MPDVVSALLAQTGLGAAARLARAGRYAEAESALDAIPEAESHAAPVLDLRARIRAQQGRLAEAAALWAEAGRLDPGNEAYRAGPRRIAQLDGAGRFWIGTAAGVVAAAALAVALLQLRSGSASVPSVLAERLEAIERRLSEPAPSLREMAVPAGAVAPLPEIDGVVQERHGSMLRLRFESGLFTSGTRLRSGAGQKLTALARHLEPWAGRLRVELIGRSDGVPLPQGAGFRDNAALAFARAQVVLARLRSAAPLPVGMFRIGASVAPGDRRSPADRSVELLLMPGPS
jgi:type VI secretion system protein ImpK